MYRLCLDIGGTKTALALVDREGTLCCQAKKSSAQMVPSTGPTDSLAVGIQDFCRENGVELSAVEGVGVPGVIDQHVGVIASCPNLTQLDGQPFAADLTERLGLPVWVENDVNLIALGEHAQGRGQGVNDMSAIYVGSGLILNGDLYAGVDGSAGELGHSVIEPDGLMCSCGGQGCVEMYCSGKALALRAASILGERSGDDESLSVRDAERVIAAARSGHPAAVDALHTMFRYLGLAVTNLVNLLNVRLVVLGGGIVNGWLEGIVTTRETVQQRGRAVSRDRLLIEPAVLGDNAGLSGAAVLVARNLQKR